MGINAQQALLVDTPHKAISRTTTDVFAHPGNDPLRFFAQNSISHNKIENR